MSVELRINVTDNATPALRSIMAKLTGEKKAELMTVVSVVARDAVQKYYTDYGNRGGWENPQLATHGSGRVKTNWAGSVAASWAIGKTDADGTSIVSDFLGLKGKTKQHTIRPKTAKWLTIPIVPEAHGVKARDYPARTGNDLFPIFPTHGPAKTPYLAEKVGGSEIRAVYLLKKSITFEPWKGALPDSESISAPVAEAIEDALTGEP